MLSSTCTKQKSLKGVTRVKRGKGALRKPERESLVPNNWHKFLKLVKNNLNFSNLNLSPEWNEGYLVFAFNDLCVINNPDPDLTGMAPCSHEEVGIRVFLLATEPEPKDHFRGITCTADTYILFLTISALAKV